MTNELPEDINEISDDLLDDIEPVGDEVLAQVLVQELFTLLGNAERNVKNSPDSAADPAYAVFWRR